MSTRTASKSSHWTKSKTAAENDRRRRERLASAAIGYIVRDTDNFDAQPTLDEPWEVRIHDVSRDGVGFITSEKMSPGDTCRIRIGHGPMRLARKMRVVSCLAEDHNHYRIGATFA